MSSLPLLNKQNWENLIELYENAYQNDNNITKVTYPILSYYTSKFSWPNFSLLDDLAGNIDDYLHSINNSIIAGSASPFILTSPCLFDYDRVNESLVNFGIRQVDQWPLLYYNLDKGFPQLGLLPDFSVKIAENETETEDWLIIVRRVLFNGKELPDQAFQSKRIRLLIGYEKQVPVATALVFFGNHATNVHMVAVLPEYRRQGYGKLIFTQAIEISHSKGYQIVFAQASQMGRKPWLEIGFEISGFVNVFWKVGYTI